MNNLFEFLTDLAVNSDQQIAFAQTPSAVIDTIGLSTADQDTLHARDSAKVTAAYSEELDQPAFCIADPNPDPMPDPDPPSESGGSQNE